MPNGSFVFLILNRQKSLVLLCIIAIIFLFLAIVQKKPESIPASSNILKGYIIAIDPGHGGRDSGSSYSQIPEKAVTLLLSKVIAEKIQGQGGTAVLTRTDDDDLWDRVSYKEEIEITKQEYLEDKKLGRRIDRRDEGIALGTRYPPTYRLGLRARLLIAEQNNADIFVSIHTNHYRAASAKGAVTLYQPHSMESRRLAISIQKYLKELLPGRAEPGIIEDNFFILRHSKIPTVLMEIGFMSNRYDRLFMLSETGQEAIAQAVVNGICDYFEGTKPIL